MQCPNKSSNEWKELVVFAGSESRAYAYYIVNNFDIPSVSQLTDKGIKPETNMKKFNRFLPIVENNLREIERLNKLLSDKNSELSSSKNKPELRTQIQTLRGKIEKLQQDNIDLSKKTALEEIEQYANEDLINAEVLMTRYYEDGLSANDLNALVKTIKLWQQAGDFSRTDHLFFTSSEMEQLDNPDNEIIGEIRTKFSAWRDRADRLQSRYIRIAEDVLNREAKQMFGDDAEVELQKAMKDVNMLFKNTIDISEVDSTLFQLMSQWNRKANFDAHEDVKEDFETVEKLIEGLRSKNKLQDFIRFLKQRQSNTDLRETGDITWRFSQKWFEDEKYIYGRWKRKIASADKEDDIVKQKKMQQDAYKELKDALKNTTLTLDTRKLFYDHPLFAEYAKIVGDEIEEMDVNFTESDKQEHIKYLKTHLGEEGYQYYYDQLQDKLVRFQEDATAQRDSLSALNEGDDATVEREMIAWNLKFNPFWNAHYAHEGYPKKKILNSWAASSKQYTTTVARKYDKDGKNLGYYDDNFAQISQDKDMFEVYTYIVESINEYVKFLPEHETDFFQVNTLPNIRKSILESFMKDGMIEGLNSTWSQIKESTREDVFTAVTPLDVNEKQLQANFITNNSAAISDYIDRKSIQYKLEHPKYDIEELYKMKEEWRKDIQHDLAQNKSWDLERTLKAFMLHTSTYKHKAKIEDSIKICRNMIDELIEQQLSAAEEPTYSKMSNRLRWKTDDLKNVRDMADHFMDNFFGYRVKKIEGKSKTKKVLTAKEKETKTELLSAIEKNAEKLSKSEISVDEFTKNDNRLQGQLEKLGGMRTWSNVFDMLLKYVQLKGLGWNIFSGISNRAFGMMGNWIESAGGQRFNQDELRKATTVMMQSTLHTNPEVSQKVRALMTRLDVLKEAKNEIFQQKINKIGKRFKWMAPYAAQSAGEYMNQGEIMIAMLLHNKVTLDGKEVSLWEAFNSDGSIKEEANLPAESEFSDMNSYIFSIKSKIDEAVRTVHGNYDFENAPLMIKKTMIGRGLAQFRTWAFMGFYDRFGSTKDSKIAGFEKKGRYTSYATLFREFGPFQATIEITKNLARKLAFQNTKFDDFVGYGKFTETDAANLRKNLQELLLYMTTTAIGLLLRASIVDDDEEQDPRYKYLTVFWINQMGRLQTDIMFYTNPMEFEKLQRQALPIFNLVQDVSRLTTHGFKLATGQTTDIYETGIYAHQRKSTRYVRNVFPFINQINRLESLGNQVIY